MDTLKLSPDAQAIIDAMIETDDWSLHRAAATLGLSSDRKFDAMEALLAAGMTADRIKETYAPQSKPEGRRLTCDEIRSIGPLLYGRRWIAELASTLGLTMYAVKHWRKDISRPLAKHTPDVVMLLRRRRDAIDAMLAQLE